MDAGREPVLRVLHIVLTLGVGGTERLVMELIRRQAGEVIASLCCLDSIGEWGNRLANDGIHVTELGRRPGFHPEVSLRIRRTAATAGVDVFHCHHYSPFVYGQLAALLGPRRPVVFTEHGRLYGSTPSWKRKLVNPILGRAGARVFAVSHDLRAYMISEGFPESRVGVIHNGIDPGAPSTPGDRHQARRRLGVPSDAEIIATVARFDPVKDLTSLIRAFALIRSQRPLSRLVMVGEGPELDRLILLSQALGVSDAVLFAGFRDDVRALLPALDVYVNSSTTEGISVSILEAMAASVPVVATRVGGTPEIVQHRLTGYLVAPGDVKGMAEAILSLLSAPDRRASVGGAARQRVLSQFTLDRMAAEYVQAYSTAWRA
jgi:glycosyltransferase involved in cell wall biosynthesis